MHIGPHVVGAPVASGGNAPHWSRWEKSATTFGPAGRIALTAGFFASVLVAGSSGLIVYVLLSPLLGWVLLPAIWAKGWVVPGEPDTQPLPEKPRVEPPPTPPRSSAPTRSGGASSRAEQR
jgi:hypothetical protein